MQPIMPLSSERPAKVTQLAARRAPRLAVLLALAFAVPMFAAPAHAADGDDLQRAVAGIEAFYGKITDFKADFQQEVRRAHLPRPLKKAGHVFFQKPATGAPKMRWDYTEPERVYYISNGEVLWSYEVATKQAIKMGVKDSDLYDSLKFLFGQGDLRASFDVTSAGAKDGLVGLILRPKNGQQNFKTLTLWAKPDTFEIKRSELVDPLDNASVITFLNANYTDTLKPEGFEFKPPKGATVQDLTKAQPGDAPPLKTPPENSPP